MEEKTRKKRKLEVNEGVEDEEKAKTQKLAFNGEKFRKELNRQNMFLSLKEFLKLAQQEKDEHIVMEYLKAGGSIQEMLLLLDKSAGSDLTSALPVFKVLHLILLSVKGKDSEFYPQAQDGVRFMLDSFVPTIEAMLNIHSGKHRKAALKLLTSTVTLFPLFGREIINFIPTTPSVLDQFLQPGPEPDSLRKCFIFFILSFIISGDISMIKSIMSMKGLLSDVIINLKSDNAHTVNMFLLVVKQKILENVKISKTLKLQVFNTQVIKSLFDLYYWKETKNDNMNAVSWKKVVKVNIVHEEDKELVTESVHAFLLVLCTSKKFGVAFSDNTFGGTGEEKNNLLSSVIQAIPEPWLKKRMSEIVIAMVQACPDLIKAVLLRTESVVKLNESKKWIKLIQFVEKLIEVVSPKDILEAAVKVSEVDIIRLARQFCTPSHLITQMCLNIQKKTELYTLYYSMRILTLIWKKMKEVLDAFEGHKKLITSLTTSYAKCFIFIGINELVEIWETVCNSQMVLDCIEKQQFLNVILDYMEMSLKFEEDVTDWPNLVSVRMLDVLDSALSDKEYLIIHSRIFYLLITIDPMSVTPDSNLFGKAMTLLLTNNDKTAIEFVTRIALTTGVFENNESEIDVWLACYFENFQEYQYSIPEAFSDSISRLYLKQGRSRKSLVEDLSKRQRILIELTNDDTSVVEKDITTGSVMKPTPLLSEFMDTMKDHKSKKDMKEYVSRVSFRLYHYYNKNSSLLKVCQRHKNEIAHTVLKYISGGDLSDFVADGSEFLIKYEKKLMMWIYKRKKHMNFEDAFSTENTNNFSLLLIFNSVTSYLIACVENDRLCDDDVVKLCSFFSFIMRLGSGVMIQSSPCILSYDVENPRLLRTKCLQSLFSLPLNKFNVYEYENQTIVNFTKIITSVLIDVSKEDLEKLHVFRPWKRKILTTVKTNLSDNSKAMQIFESLEPILNRFTYTLEEISEVLREYSQIRDMKTFVVDGRITMSTLILVKFVKFHSELAEISENTVGQLRNIMGEIMEDDAENLNVLNDSFVYLLANRPRTLSAIPNDFMEILLRRSRSSENLLNLGKLLLGDPIKIDYFIRFAAQNFKDLKNKKTIVAIFSSLILKEADPFLELLRRHKFCNFWKENELLGQENESDASQLMEMIYNKYRKSIFLEKSRDVEFVLQHEEFFSILTKCHHDKESLSGMKNKIAEGSFLPGVLHEMILMHKDEYDILEIYTRGLLVICTEKLKEAENGTCVEEMWSKYGKYVGDIVRVKMDCNWKDLRKDSIWKDFVCLSLRLCFNFPDCPSFMKTIRHFIELLLTSRENDREIKNIFDMVISHSQFLSVMLYENRLKLELVKLYYFLIQRNHDILSIKHIPVILAAYTGSLSETDVTLLNILRFYELNNMNMNEYEPIVWGEPAIAHYSVKTNVGMSLWRRINMLNVLEMLDSKRMEASLKEFPIGRTGIVNEDEFNEKVYDPAFLLPIFANLLSHGAVTYCLPFVQKGCFAYTLCALSSTNKDIRITASVVLARLYNHLELVQMMKLKSVWLHFINCVRFAIDNIEEKPIPSVVTYFLGKTSLELSGEPGLMYTSLQKFLVAKPVFSFDYIPEFLPLFHSSDINYVKHRRWILEILRDGFKHNNDLDVIFRTMAIKIILSFFRSELCTQDLKPLILEVVTTFLKSDKSRLLISEYGLLTWLSSISLACKKELFPPFVKLLSAATIVIKTKLIKNLPGKRNLFYPIQILNILVKIIPNLSECRSVAVVELYLTILLDFLLIMFRLNHKNWCSLNRSKLSSLNNVVASFSHGRKIADRYVNLKFFSTFYIASNEMEKLYRKIVFLWDVLSRRSSDS